MERTELGVLRVGQLKIGIGVDGMDNLKFLTMTKILLRFGFIIRLSHGSCRPFVGRYPPTNTWMKRCLFSEIDIPPVPHALLLSPKQCRERIRRATPHVSNLPEIYNEPTLRDLAHRKTKPKLETRNASNFTHLCSFVFCSEDSIYFPLGSIRRKLGSPAASLPNPDMFSCLHRLCAFLQLF